MLENTINMVSSIILTFDFLSFFITTMDVLTHILDNSNNDILLRVICSYQPLDFYIPLIDHTFSQKWIFIGNETYRNDKKHSFNDQPAVIDSYGNKYWYQHSKYHRDNDQPAIINSNGNKAWCQYGKIHRDNDQPAIIYSNGNKEWWQHGNRHRDSDRPAVIWSNDDKYWYQHGELHRDNDKPALILSNDSKEYYKNGIEYYPNI